MRGSPATRGGASNSVTETPVVVWLGDLQLDFELLSEDLVESEVCKFFLIAGFDGCAVHLVPSHIIELKFCTTQSIMEYHMNLPRVLHKAGKFLALFHPQELLHSGSAQCGQIGNRLVPYHFFITSYLKA
jgi:hypothetical protein